MENSLSGSSLCPLMKYINRLLLLKTSQTLLPTDKIRCVKRRQSDFQVRLEQHVRIYFILHQNPFLITEIPFECHPTFRFILEKI